MGYFVALNYFILDDHVLIMFHQRLLFQAGAAGGAMAGTMATSDGHRYLFVNRVMDISEPNTRPESC